MRVLVAGASGAIGRPLLPRLLRDGHTVIGMSRSPKGADAIGALGAQPLVCDALDPDAVMSAVAGVAPDAIIHQLTALPAAIEPRRLGRQLAATDRLRREGTRNLVDAALAAGTRRFVAQSVAFMYAPAGGPVKSEEDPLYLDAPPTLAPSIEAVAELERIVRQTPGIDGLVLRYGYFYGPGTAYAADGSIAAQVRRRRFPIVGAGTGTYSFVHVEDAADATALALGRGAPGVYNVVDDEPAAVSAWLPAYAAAIGAPPPRRVPELVARVVAGSVAVYQLNHLRGATNAKAMRELGWTPAHPSWRTGFRAALG